MDRYKKTRDVAGVSQPSEGWLFAQAILGRPIPRMMPPEAQAKAQREELGRLARFSYRQAKELRELQSAEANARRDRELLEWAAQISAEAEDKLRAIQQIEARDSRTWHAIERFTESDSLVVEWNEADHPRAPKGTPIGGQWINKGGGGGGINTGKSRSPRSKGPGSGGSDESDGSDSHMLDLAHAWWQTKNALDHTRRQIKELPKRIKSYHAQRNSIRRSPRQRRSSVARVSRKSGMP